MSVGIPLKAVLKEIYGSDQQIVGAQLSRYESLLSRFSSNFSRRAAALFSSPGRIEIGGNHTDHNHGLVLAAAINLDGIAAAAPNESGKVTLISEGYSEPFVVDLNSLVPREEEKGTTAALIRGIAAGMQAKGFRIGGFDAVMTSDVGIGSGLSSSASLEMLIGKIFDAFYNGGQIPVVTLAQIGQYAENVHFGKPCGLMDQIACGMGGIVAIDFRDPLHPAVQKLSFDFSSEGFSLAVVNTGGSHEDLTAEYAAIPEEMKQVARYFGAEVCRDVQKEQLIQHISDLRRSAGDRAILRALHFLDENQRVQQQVSALKEKDVDTFLRLVKESGDSSCRWLQNCHSASDPEHQGISLALAATEQFFRLAAKGACRVHGGGFAGTILAILSDDWIEEYEAFMNSIFGEDAVHVLSIREEGVKHSVLEMD